MILSTDEKLFNIIQLQFRIKTLKKLGMNKDILNQNNNLHKTSHIDGKSECFSH
jgi:hypothetical protein